MITRIGKYQIEGELGRGGFGRVYRAYDPTVGRPVAIKVLTAPGDASLLSRFRNEAFAAGNLQHKNIVTVYDFGEYDGVPYLAMEYLDGESLSAVLSRNRPLSLLEKIRIMREVAEGLGCAHKHGVIHRDIKPANIMLLSDGNVKIMDFGIARLMRNEAVRLTQTGYMVGTLPYMAPEQLGPASETDVLCDIWAYGVIYYEILTGANPFNAGDAAAILYRLATYHPPPVSHACECPVELDDVIGKILRRERDERYQNLAEIQYDIEPIYIELKKREAAKLVLHARERRSRNEFEEADSVIHQALDLDASNPDARALREELRRRLNQARKDRPKAELLIAQAEERLGKREYDEALHLLESARAIDPANSRIAPLLASISAARQTQQQYQQLITEAEAHRAAQRLTLAFQKASEARELLPDDERVRAVLADVERDIADRDRSIRLREELLQARRMIVGGLLNEAIDSLNSLASAYPESLEVVALLERTRQQRDEKARSERIIAGVSAAKELLINNFVEEAVSALQALAGEFPGVADIDETLSDACRQLEARRRDEAIEATARSAWKLSKTKNFDEAISKLEQALALYPGDERLSRVQRAITEAQAEYVRECDVAQLKELRSAGRLTEALNVLNNLVIKYDGDVALQDEKREIEAALHAEHERIRDERLQSFLQLARERITAGELDGAIALLHSLLRDAPVNANVIALLDEAQSLLAARARQSEIVVAVETATEQGRVSDWKGARRTIQEALAKYPNADELLAAAGRIDKTISEEERRELFKTHIRSIEQAVTAHDWEQCRERLRDAELMFPQDPRLVTLRTQVSEQEQREDAERRRELDRYCARIRESLGNENWNEAYGVINEALLRFPNHAALIGLRDRFHVARERRLAITKAEQELRQRRIENAQAALRPLLANDEKDAEAEALLNEIERRQADEQRQRDIQAALGVANAAERNGEFDAALACIEQALARWPAARELTAAADRMRALRDESARRQSLERRIASITQALGRHDWAGAAELLDDAEAAFPAEASVRGLRDLLSEERARDDARKRREVDEFNAQIRGCIAREDWSAAASAVQHALTRFPGNRTLARLGEELDQRRQRRDSLTQAEQRLRNGAYQEAESAVQAVLAHNPTDSEAEALLVAIRKQRDHQEDKKQYAAACEELEHWSRERNYDEVIKAAKAALARFPGDSLLQSQLSSAIAARELAERNKKIAAAILDLELLFQNGNVAEVHRTANEILALHEEPRARELLAWAEEALRRPPVAATDSNRSETGSEPSRVRRIGAWIGIAALIAISSGLWVYFSRRDSEPLLVRPEALTFMHQEGSATVPAAQTVHVNGASAVAAVSTTDRWLKTKTHNGNSEIAVTIDPGALRVGQHSGYVNITAADGRTRSIAVHAIIEPPMAHLPPSDLTRTEPKPLVAREEKKQTLEPTRGRHLRGAEHEKTPEEVARVIPTAPDPKAAPAAPLPPATKACAAEHFELTNYGDLTTGRLTWSGQLPRSAELTIIRRASNPPGAVRGYPVPNVPVHVSIVPDTVRIQMGPSAGNCWDPKLVLVNTGDAVSNITIDWKVFQP